MTVMSLKIKKSVKERGQKAAAALGLPFGTMINVLIMGVINTNTLNVTYAETPSARLIQSIEDAKKDHENGEYYTANTAEELDALLDSFSKV